MHATWRYDQGDMEYARRLIKQELPYRLHEELLANLDPGKARWLTHQFENGARGLALDYRDLHWETLDLGSSSCNLEPQGVIKADPNGHRLDLSVTPFARWVDRLDQPGWPFAPCLFLFKGNMLAEYFGREVRFELQQFKLLQRLAEISGKRRGAVPDHEIVEALQIGRSGAHLTSVLSRIRRSLRATAASLPANLSVKAESLVAEILPEREKRKGYRVGRHKLIRIV